MCLHRAPKRTRRGIALLDALMGGLLLALTLSVVMSITTRALSTQTDGEKRMTAAWLADELLSMVVVKGPDEYPLVLDTSGAFGYPFEEFDFEVEIEELGRGLPYRVLARVSWGDRPRDAVEVETLVALRGGEPMQEREPLERIDREDRYFGEDEEAAP